MFSSDPIELEDGCLQVMQTRLLTRGILNQTESRAEPRGGENQREVEDEASWRVWILRLEIDSANAEQTAS